MTALLRFCGSRLRDARVARGQTASSLAEVAGVSAAAISQYEHGDASPKPGVLAKLAGELRLPEPHFFRPTRPVDPAPYLYRSLAAATKRAREAAEVRQRWCMDIYDFVLSYVTMPPPKIDDLGFDANPMRISPEEIERAASTLRAAWGLGDGPIRNMVETLEAHGCALSRFAFGAEKLSSFSQFAMDRPVVMLNGDYDSAVRCRFNAAHELGHLVLHRRIDQRTADRPEVHKQMEAQAHRFAAAFLFPSAAVGDEVYSLAMDAVRSVKARWLVSMQMVLRRARDLELATQDQYERAMRELSRRGYRAAEPLDDELPVEKPTVLSKSIQMMLDNGAVTRPELLYRLPFSATDIEILAQLPRGYLQSDQWGEVLHLRTDPPTSKDGTYASNILLFPKKP
jgi:Zn-dependent peptidase ImmA (M78 family)/DNA-binding XRE family transcriptional regulator